jgi:hypothetical protein
MYKKNGKDSKQAADNIFLIETYLGELESCLNILLDVLAEHWNRIA